MSSISSSGLNLVWTCLGRGASDDRLTVRALLEPLPSLLARLIAARKVLDGFESSRVSSLGGPSAGRHPDLLNARPPRGGGTRAFTNVWCRVSEFQLYGSAMLAISLVHWYCSP